MSEILRLPRPVVSILVGLLTSLGIGLFSMVLSAAETPEAHAKETTGSKGSTPSSHWSLQPIRRTSCPSCDSAHLEQVIDTFVRAQLEKAGLQPSPRADKRTLIRRLYFDLVGLPPSNAEVESFLQDASPTAYEHLVDRLLDSPHFGERWGRHWLDIVRYTESQGFEYDKLRDNAWHYRDYVIESFNQDKPYDRFIREQIAGDVLQPTSTAGLIGTSLLVCGPWDEAGNSQANVTQRQITREEEMEDMIGVVGQTFLGLTVNCARCHTHKFDPIPQTDYYRIKSVLEGVKHGERSVATPEQQRVRETRIAELKKEIAEHERSLAQIEDIAWKRAWDHHPRKSTEAPPSVKPFVAWNFENSQEVLALGSLQGGAKIEKQTLRLNGQGQFYRSEPIRSDIREKTLEAWVSLADLNQGGGAAISIESPSGSPFDAIVFGERQPRKWMAGSESFARTKDLKAPEETATESQFIHVVAVYSEDRKIQLYRNGEPYGSSYVTESAIPKFQGGEARVLIGMRHTGGGKAFLQGSIRSAAVYDRALQSNEVHTLYLNSGYAIPKEEQLSFLSPEESKTRASRLDQLAAARQALEAIPPLPVSYVGVRKQPEPTHLLKRGDVKSPAEIVTPGALSAIPGLNSDFGLPADAPEADRRVRFAEWLTDPKNPLPARVIVNRLWQFHFGQGFVTTPNDFGKSGSPPSHPELLDWLASELIEHGWKLKHLHRAIVLSQTYQQASAPREDAMRRDSDNQLLWRFTPQRMEAETLRDAMLSVSGEINLQMGGPSFRSFEIQKFPANAYVPTDKLGPEFNRRSVYRMNVNSGKEPLMDAFDCPDPAVKTPRRGVTTTPLQALGMMNNSFVLRQAHRLAERATAAAQGDSSKAIDWIYATCLSRPPTDDERARAQSAVRERGLNSLCWAMLNSTEFLFVR